MSSGAILRLSLAALVFGVGCAAPLRALTHEAPLDTGSGMFQLTWSDPDAQTVERVQESIRRVSTRMSRWGVLKHPVRVNLLPTHEMLEEAVDRPGYGWLRAWARYDEIFLQSPRTWSILGATQGEIDELMLHELTHCLMYQLSGTRSNWPRKQIPLWFREGMASYTAQQGYRWPTLEELARFLRRHPEHDPVGAPETLYQGESDMVYASAHHAFGFLVRRYGEERIREVMSRMDQGAQFPRAFEAAVGVSHESFVEDFKRFVRLRGFRGSRLRVQIPLPLIRPSLVPDTRVDETP